MSAGAGPAAGLCALTPEGTGGVGDLGRGRREEGGGRVAAQSRRVRKRSGRAGGRVGELVR